MATALFSLPAQSLHAPLPTAPPHVHEPREVDLPRTHTQDPRQENHHHGDDDDDPAPQTAHRQANVGSGVDLGTLTGRRITLKPRRTLSLSPTPARTGDMSMSMGRNLRAARCLDFTDKDDDDGLYQPSDSDSEAGKKKGETVDEENNNNISSLLKSRHKRGTSVGGGIIGSGLVSALGGSATTGILRRTTGSVKRPLDHVLPCQEIQYLDISYQKHIIPQVQYSPIPRKKIAYHHVPYNSIPYCEVPYCGTGERPVKRLQRSHSIAVADLREPEDCEWTSSYKFSEKITKNSITIRNMLYTGSGR